MKKNIKNPNKLLKRKKIEEKIFHPNRIEKKETSQKNEKMEGKKSPSV